MKDANVKEMFAGLFLAKFDKEGLDKLGFASFQQAYNCLASAVGGKPGSVKNYRDEFDVVFPNGRKGWHKRPMHKTRVEMLNQYGSLGMEEMYDLLLEMFSDIEKYDAKLDDLFENGTSGEEVARKSADLAKDMDTPIPYVDVLSKEGREKYAMAKMRVNQSTFRRWMLKLYSGKCCLTGLPLASLLEACHISSWDSDVANRMNPENGICLTSLHHKAFDLHLISLDEDYRMVLSKSMKEYVSKDVFHEYFGKFQGVRISLPSKYLPSQEFLSKHRSLLKI
ncbi:MAG: HNH endonuclease [Victivallaceae bacterium]|nr:HNH endonuclease [Victivallaceae bacterium]